MVLGRDEFVAFVTDGEDLVVGGFEVSAEMIDEDSERARGEGVVLFPKCREDAVSVHYFAFLSAKHKE